MLEAGVLTPLQNALALLITTSNPSIRILSNTVGKSGRYQRCRVSTPGSFCMAEVRMCFLRKSSSTRSGP